jgi:hypothetical protein
LVRVRTGKFQLLAGRGCLRKQRSARKFSLRSRASNQGLRLGDDQSERPVREAGDALTRGPVSSASLVRSPTPGLQQGRVKTRPSSKRLQYRPGAARFRKLRTLGTCRLGLAGVSGGRLRLCKDNQLSLMDEGSCVEGSAHVQPRGDEVRRVRQQSHSQPGSCCRWLVGWQRKRDGGRGGHAITVAER